MPAKRTSQNLPQPLSLWQTIGPSFILLGLALGSGELILWPYLAANWGLGLLWGALLGISFQYILNTEVMRYTLAWGESVFVGFRRLSVLLPIWFIISTFIPWSIPGFSSASSAIMTNFLPWLPEKAVAVLLLLFTGFLLSAGQSIYKTMETFQKLIILLGLPFLFVLTLVLADRGDWLEAVWGLAGRGDGWWLLPPNVSLAAFLGAFAFSGAGGNLNLAQSYYIKEKGFGMGKYAGKISSLFSGKARAQKLEGSTFALTPANRQRWQGWWRLVKQEHLLVFWTLGFAMIMMMSVLAKATVYEKATDSGLSFLYLESGVISSRLHPSLGVFYLLVSAIMLFSTQVGVLESSSRIISENILLIFHRKGKKANLTHAFYAALWGQILLGVGVYLFGFTEPRLLLTLTAVLNAVAMMVSFPLVYWLNFRLDQSLRATLFRKLVMLAAFLFFSYFVVVTAMETFSL